MNIKIKDCFTENGNLKFDPYRMNIDSVTPIQFAMYNLIFTEDGYLQDRNELVKFIDKHPEFKWDCHAIGLYHADLFAYSTKSHYPTFYYFR